MSNWDIYETGIKALGFLYLVTFFTNPVVLILNIQMILFFGWVGVAGSAVYLLEGGMK